MIPTSISTTLSFLVANILGLSSRFRNMVRLDNSKSIFSEVSFTPDGFTFKSFKYFFSESSFLLPDNLYA